MAHLAEVLRVRREVAKAAGVRSRRRKIPLQRFPTGAQLRYQTLLTSMRRTMEMLLRDVLFPALPALIEAGNQERSGLRSDAVTDDILRVFSGIALQFATAHPLQSTTAEITTVGGDINSKQKGEHQRQMEAALGIVPIVPEPFVQASMRAFIAENQDLVSSLFGRQLEDFKAITSRGIRSGLRVESIRDELIAKLGISKGRASLLARDQTLKLFGELNELRQVNVGITEYEWNDSRDERVRARHNTLHGTRQKWASPPIVDVKSGRRAHPGGDFQCRCQGIPVIPEELLAGD